MRAGADNQRFSHLAQPPARGDARNLPRGIRAVGSGTNQASIGPALDAPQHGVIAAVEKILHQPGHGGQVFRRGENIAIRRQHVLWSGLCGAQQARLRTRLICRRFGCRPRHLFGAARGAVPDNEKLLHAAMLPVIGVLEKALPSASPERGVTARRVWVR